MISRDRSLATIFWTGAALVLGVMSLLGNSRASAQDAAASVESRIDWPAFLARHDLVWKKTPNDYFNSAFLGNGPLGAMFYCPEGADPVKPRIDVGRRDVLEHRDTGVPSILDNGRLPVGHFTLTMNSSSHVDHTLRS